MTIRYRYLEERAEACLLAMREPGWLTTHGAEKMIQWARPFVTARRCAVQEAEWRTARNGRSRILIPNHLKRWHRNRALLHELGHPLLDVGMADITQWISDEESEKFRIAMGADRYEEMLCDEFILALRLPARLVVRFGDVKEIGVLSGMPWERIHHRIYYLNGEILKLTYVPYWSAARAFRLELHGRKERSLLLFEGEAVQLRVPVDASNFAMRERRLKLDLVALRPKEFLAKYYAFVPRLGEPHKLSLRPRTIRVEMDELRWWAGIN